MKTRTLVRIVFHSVLWVSIFLVLGMIYLAST